MEVTIDNIQYELDSSNNTAKVVCKESKYAGDVVIPSHIYIDGIEYAVVVIGNWAFDSCSNLSSVVIPSSVNEIGQWAFNGCNLQSIVIPKSVKVIGEHAFSSGENLVEIRIESKKTKYDSRNNCNAMIDTTSNSLIIGCKNTIIPNDIKIIKQFAFVDSSLTSIIIPPNVIDIEDEVNPKS